MTHTNLYKNEIYLIVTSLISIGVLGGYAYFDLALAALIILPAINTLDKNIFSRKKSHSDNLNKCASCK